MIKSAQISPYDKCNAGCWYCPVRYYEQPETQHMPPALFERIISELVANKGGIVSPSFDFIYTAHYNEVLLYKHFEEMLDILKKYKIKTMILTNGIAFTDDKIAIVDRYRDVVIGINFNIPEFTNESLMDTVRKVYAKFGKMVSIGVNSMNAAECNQRVAQGRAMFPGLNIYPAVGLSDRAGLLHDKGVISNRTEIERNRQGKTRIVGCRNSERLTDWLHVNAYGKVFSCCDDYFFEHVYGDLNTQSLKDIYPYRLGLTLEMCEKCSFARWA